MEYAFFVGCTTLARLPGYEKSARRVAETLGIELKDMPGSSCCGTTYLDTLDTVTALAMAARNICIAEEMCCDIVTVCNGCTEVLTKANRALKADPELRSKVNEVLKRAGREFKGTVEVKHYVRMLKEDYGLDKIEEKTVKGFSDLRVGAHYGCHMMKPSDVMQTEDPENPQVLDDIIEAAGATHVDYPTKLECCAGPIMGIRENITWQVGLDKVKTIMKYGDAMVTACPFCYLTFERGQLLSEDPPNLPVLHITQLLGLALGLNEEELGLKHNKIDSGPVLQKLEEKEC